MSRLPDREEGSTEVVYSSEDESVANISDGIVYALKPGVVVLWAKSADGKFSVRHNLTVTAPEKEFDIKEAANVKVSSSGTVWNLTVTEDVSLLSIGKLVHTRSGYSWILAKDVEMTEEIVSRTVSLPDTGVLTVYAFCYNADRSFEELYTLHIQKQLSFTITLDPDGGTLDKEAIGVIYGQSFTLPVPEKEGEAFDGWFLGEDLFEKTVYDLKSDLTLKAHWHVVEQPEPPEE